MAYLVWSQVYLSSVTTLAVLDPKMDHTTGRGMAAMTFCILKVTQPDFPPSGHTYCKHGSRP